MTAAGQPPRAQRVSTRDISPNRRRGGDLRIVLGPATVGATAGFLGVLTLHEGEYVAEHYHPYSEEFLYVTEGDLSVRIEGDYIDLAAGEGVLVPTGQRHRVEKRGPGRCVAVFQLCPLAPHPSLGHVDIEPLAPAAGAAPQRASGTAAASASGTNT
jgi:putative monooxygenase